MNFTLLVLVCIHGVVALNQHFCRSRRGAEPNAAAILEPLTLGGFLSEGLN